MCSVALYMVISSVGEKIGDFEFFAVQPSRTILGPKRRERRLPGTRFAGFAAPHNYNCRDTNTSSQELFGAPHHLSGLGLAVKSKRPLNQRVIIGTPCLRPVAAALPAARDRSPAAEGPFGAIADYFWSTR